MELYITGTSPTKKVCSHYRKLMIWFLLFISLANNVDAQPDLLNRNIKLTQRSYILKELLKELNTLEDINLSYNEKDLKMNSSVDFSKRELTLQQILDNVCRNNNCTFNVVGDYIIIKRKSAPEKNKKEQVTINGIITDKATGETLIGATVYIKELQIGAVSNAYGFYSLSLHQGTYSIQYSFVGYEPVEKKLTLEDDATLHIELSPKTEQLEEVLVTATKQNENVVSSNMGYAKISSQSINSIPVLMGEADVLKAIKLMPGIQSTGETSSGFVVRGGGRDQNLVILDEATVYNVSHLMGFFSVFNNDAVKSSELYKGNIPVRYGGRLSSVLDIRMKEGNNKKFSGNGGLGLIASRLSLEGPIVKDKGSFLISGRRTYVDLFTRNFGKKDVRDLVLFFYDLNLKTNYTINPNNRIYLSAYFGRDHFKFKKLIDLEWGNNTETLRWNHIFNNKLFSNLSFIFSNYDYKLKQSGGDLSFIWGSQFREYAAKLDFGYYWNANNTLNFGLISGFHKFQPGKVTLENKSSREDLQVPLNQAIESAFYISNEQKIGTVLVLQYGIRYALFQNIGKTTVYNFNDAYEKVDSSVYGKGKIFNTYTGLEPRAGINIILSEKHSIKAGYSKTMQFIQLASNSTGGTPLDIWVPSSPNIKPQVSHQYSIGYFRNLSKNNVEFSTEVYYKQMKNQIDFKDHAEILLNELLEGELRFGKAQAYGIEFMLHKKSGNLNGWIGYTISRAERKFKEINNGKPYLSPYDQTHNFSIVGNYKISSRISLSANWTYLSGRAFTSPTGKFIYQNVIAPVYSDRNADRMPAYHRMDIGLNIASKNKRRLKSYFNISVYNIYNRKNPNVIYFGPDDYNTNKTVATKISVLPIIPTITYNFRF